MVICHIDFCSGQLMFNPTKTFSGIIGGSERKDQVPSITSQNVPPRVLTSAPIHPMLLHPRIPKPKMTDIYAVKLHLRKFIAAAVPRKKASQVDVKQSTRCVPHTFRFGGIPLGHCLSFPSH